jgi:hypothetical protein
VKIKKHRITHTDGHGDRLHVDFWPEDNSSFLVVGTYGTNDLGTAVLISRKSAVKLANAILKVAG